MSVFELFFLTLAIEVSIVAILYLLLLIYSVWIILKMDKEGAFEW